MRRYGHAVLGGTFDHLHVGHAALLGTAFRVGRTVSIGLTTDSFLRAHPKPFAGRMQPYPSRRRALQRWLRRTYPGRDWRVVPLENPFGRSVEEGVGVLVVSQDTLAGGVAVNVERRRLGRKPVPLAVVPVVLADDLGPVSSRRVREGAIDRLGHRKSRIAVGLAVSDLRDRAAAAGGIRHVFPRATVSGRPPGRSGPLAVRASLTLAVRALGGHELGVGVVRTGAASWAVSEAGPRVRLGPFRVEGRGPAALRRGVERLLRPAVERKAFPP